MHLLSQILWTLMNFLKILGGGGGGGETHPAGLYANKPLYKESTSTIIRFAIWLDHNKNTSIKPHI